MTLTEQGVNDLQKVITTDLEGVENVRVTITEHIHDITKHVTRWVAVWMGSELLFTVNSIEEWRMIYNLFEKVFSGPSSQEIAEMENHYSYNDFLGNPGR